MSANQPREDTRSAVQRLEGTSRALKQEYTRQWLLRARGPTARSSTGLVFVFILVLGV